MDDIIAWLSLHALLVHRARLGTLLLQRFGDPTRILYGAREHLDATPSEWDVVQSLRAALDIERSRHIVQTCHQRGIQIVALRDAAYPPLLREIPDPPIVLFARGDSGLLQHPAPLAIVGTRKASAYGRQITEEWGDAVSRAGVLIVSGLAFGIDALAHRAALQAGQPTVAVLASGVDLITPRSHQRLGEEILQQGLICSEYLPGTHSQPQYYPQRNRIISGLSVGTLVVEAAEKSGTMWTAQHCSEQGRLLLTPPGSVFHHLSAGPHRLIRDGAIAVRHAADIMEELGRVVDVEIIRRHARAGQASSCDAMGPHLLQWLATPRTIAEIAALNGDSISAAMGRLTLLEAQGLIQRTADGMYMPTSLPSGRPTPGRRPT